MVKLGRRLNSPYYLCKGLITYAEWLTDQQRYIEAQTLNQEAATIASEVQREDVQFTSTVLALRLRAALGASEAITIVQDFEQMLAKRTQKADLATLHYEIWHLDRSQFAHQQRASELYQTLYASTVAVDFRNRVEELTGQKLPDPPALPELPHIIQRQPVELDNLLAQLDQRV